MDVPPVPVPASGDASAAPGVAEPLLHENIQRAEIHDQLRRILASKGFRRSERLRRFLQLAIERTLAGEAGQLKEYSVGRDVFDRGPDYDTRMDSIVRVEARRLRKKLREFYQEAGPRESVVIQIPSGSYVPQFTRMPQAELEVSVESESGPILTGPPDPCTVAVLPFSNLSQEAEQQYFCDGITEDIINALTPIAQLQVIGRTTMFAIEPGARDLRELGLRLGAGTIVEGSVRKAGELLRVSAKIIDSESRQTKWSQVFDRQTQELFAIEDEIAHSIAGVLRITLQPLATARTAPSTEAHTLYLKGRQAWNQMTRAGFSSAVELFDRAIALYPEYAPPYAGLAFAYMWMTLWGALRPSEAFQKCETAAKKALRLDPHLASAYASWGACVFFLEKNYQEGLTLLKKAIELQPSYAIAHQLYGTFLLILGRFDEAIAPLERSVHLDPLSLRTNRTLGSLYYVMGRAKDAKHWMKVAIAVRPDSPETYFLLARVYLQQGELAKALSAARRCDCDGTNAVTISILGVVLARMGDIAGAQQILRRFEEMSSYEYVDPLASAFIETALGNHGAALDLLRKSREEQSPFAAYANVDPLLEELRADPEFNRL